MNTRSFFASLMPPNLPPLLLLPRPVNPLPILHTLLVHGFSIPVHLIICLVIRISSLPLLSLHPYLQLLWLMGLKPWPKESGLPIPSHLQLLLLFSMSLILHLTKQPYTLLPTHSFMKGPSILKWTVTLFERRLLQDA